jgi:hypothetical protein
MDEECSVCDELATGEDRAGTSFCRRHFLSRCPAGHQIELPESEVRLLVAGLRERELELADELDLELDPRLRGYHRDSVEVDYLIEQARHVARVATDAEQDFNRAALGRMAATLLGEASNPGPGTHRPFAWPPEPAAGVRRPSERRPRPCTRRRRRRSWS